MIALRTVLVMMTLILLTFLITTPGYHAASLLISLFLVAQCILVFRFITKTNAELARFLDAARYADFSQRFELKSLGAGFGELVARMPHQGSAPVYVRKIFGSVFR